MSNSYDDINNVEKYHLNIGESISFDGTKIYHGVMPVTNGVRCALNIWMTNTNFKYRPLKNNKSII
jgi:predicted 2-oxoglutarate/Fe(II)-dependent dioxygenase YbiX